MRNGLTLIETLIVLAIVGTLSAITVPAVQRVREASLRMQSLNNLRQIAVATHNYVGSHQGRLPIMADPRWHPYGDKDAQAPLFVSLLPYLGEQRLYEWFQERDDPARLAASFAPVESKIRLSVFLNPLDPSESYAERDLFTYQQFMHSATSYACNAQVFDLCPRLMAISDGTSNTIFLTEHYWQCRNTQFNFSAGFARRRLWRELHITRATFADGGPLVGKGDNCRDFYPITKGEPPVSAARHNKSFQVAPRPDDCDPRVPNAASSVGLQVAMGDGSVRLLSPSMAPHLFWGAVTPNKQDLTSVD